MSTYYNENDPKAAAWLRELIKGGHIPAGFVDERSIEDVRPSDLIGYRQHHFFAGIGGWALALRWADWPEDKPVWTGSCPCFPSGTLVLTGRGHVSIDSVQVGDKVLTHRGRWRSVQAVGSDEADIVQVKGQGHWGLLTTKNHPFLTGEDEWTAAESLAGERWRTVAAVPPSPFPPIENIKGVMEDRGRWRATGWKNGRTVYLGRFKSRDEAVRCRTLALAEGRIKMRGADGADVASPGFARFLGFWLGDGWTSGNTVFLCGEKGDAPLLNGILNGAGLSCSLSKERTTDRARCGSKPLVRWLGEHFGATASGKRIPAWVHGAPPEWRREFLRGYQEADGHRECGSERFTTVSRAIAVGVRVLLNQDGKSASITWQGTKPRTIQGRDVSTAGGFYRVTSYDRARSFSFNDLHGVGYVRKVVPAGKGRVFNLAVEEDQSYTADGIVVHNCQPFSAAGRHGGVDDPRHLWPAWRWLIDQCRPPIVFGEQVASKAGRAWFSGVSHDLEAMGYSAAAADLCAASVGAPHIRQRLWFVGSRLGDGGFDGLEGYDRHGDGCGELGRIGSGPSRSTAEAGATGGMADANPPRRRIKSKPDSQPIARREKSQQRIDATGRCDDSRPGTHHGGWANADWLGCRDGKFRPAEPGTFPLAHGLPARVGRLRGYGNAIVPQVAAEFAKAFMEIC